MVSYYNILRLIIFVEFLFWKTNDVHCFVTEIKTVNENRSSNTLIDFLNVTERAPLYSAKQYAINDSRLKADHLHSRPMDCAEIYERNKSSKSGTYKVWPRNRIIKCPVTVYCDMVDDGGAWTVIQRRGDFDSPKDYFYRDWMSYKIGFGDLLKDFWLGNDNIFALTNERASTVKFDLSDWEGNVTYATYDDFWIDDETHNYTLHITGYRGKAGDSLTFSNGYPFTTKDSDNDEAEANCAVTFKGAWWYVACHASNLNGLYLKGAHESYADGVDWTSFRGHHYSLKDTVIKIRPKYFRKRQDSEMSPH